MISIQLNSKKRQELVHIPEKTKKITIKVSRDKCMDVLTEIINDKGHAKGKPLQKWLPQIQVKNVSQIRFTMNDFSTKPIEIELHSK